MREEEYGGRPPPNAKVRGRAAPEGGERAECCYEVASHAANLHHHRRENSKLLQVLLLWLWWLVGKGEVHQKEELIERGQRRPVRPSARHLETESEPEASLFHRSWLERRSASR